MAEALAYLNGGKSIINDTEKAAKLKEIRSNLTFFTSMDADGDRYVSLHEFDADIPQEKQTAKGAVKEAVKGANSSKGAQSIGQQLPNSDWRQHL